VTERDPVTERLFRIKLEGSAESKLHDLEFVPLGTKAAEEAQAFRD
jgi:hypothetical protein